MSLQCAFTKLKALRANIQATQRQRLLDIILSEDPGDLIAKERYDALSAQERDLQDKIQKAETRLFKAGNHHYMVYGALALLENLQWKQQNEV
jgi:hypothetical protein